MRDISHLKIPFSGFFGAAKLKSFFFLALSGLIFAYFVSSLIGLLLYKDPSLTLPEDLKKDNIGQYKKAYTPSEIIERNIFALAKIREKAEKAKIDDIPLVKSNIKNYRLIGVILGDGGMALLRGDREAHIISKGEVFEGYKLASLSFNKAEFKRHGSKIILELPKQLTTTQATPNVLPAVSPRRREAGQTAAADADMSPTPIGDRTTITRQEMLAQAKEINQLLTTVLISPHHEGGEFVGYRLSRLKDGSFLHQLGFRRGDIIKRVNGKVIDSPEEAMRLFARLGDMTAISVDMLREGKKTSLFVEII
ncbi:hypothetical protein M1M93_01170 [Thermodesulfovibrionales bacterium]|nr:hypothetical protein [Thermodesulfovibrionales bacterium]MCL0084994.1 hypothetical protein [Thermodesulfovibrionales bacterium]